MKINLTREERGVLLNLIAEKIDKDAYKETESYCTGLFGAQKKMLAVKDRE